MANFLSTSEYGLVLVTCFPRSNCSSKTFLWESGIFAKTSLSSSFMKFCLVKLSKRCENCLTRWLRLRHLALSALILADFNFTYFRSMATLFCSTTNLLHPSSSAVSIAHFNDCRLSTFCNWVMWGYIYQNYVSNFVRKCCLKNSKN